MRKVEYIVVAGLVCAGLYATVVGFRPSAEKLAHELASELDTSSKPKLEDDPELAALLEARQEADGVDKAAISQALAKAQALAQSPDSDETGEASNYEKLRAELKRLNACYKSECGYPRTDPKSYELALNADIAKTLNRLHAVIEDDSLVNSDISKSAREFLNNPDSKVKEGALNLLATQPPSPENLDAILSQLGNGFNAILIEQALIELERYKRPEDIAKIQTALGETIATGAPAVTEPVSEGIGSFVNEQNLVHFDSVLARLPAGSPTHENLKAAIDQKRQKTNQETLPETLPETNQKSPEPPR